MQPKFKIKVPSPSASSAITGKVLAAAKRAVKRATPKIKASITEVVADEALRGDGGDRYVRDIKRPGVISVTVTHIVVEFHDPIVRAIEAGAKAFDLKAKMLAKASKTSKRGVPFIDVPFTHAAKRVPKSIKTTLKTAPRAYTITPGKAFTRTLHLGGSKTQAQKVQHARGISDDMMRRNGKYTTVRRISAKSPASSWWHPGFKGRRILKKLDARIRTSTLALLKTAFTDEGFKVK